MNQAGDYTCKRWSSQCKIRQWNPRSTASSWVYFFDRIITISSIIYYLSSAQYPFRAPPVCQSIILRSFFTFNLSSNFGLGKKNPCNRRFTSALIFGFCFPRYVTSAHSQMIAHFVVIRLVISVKIKRRMNWNLKWMNSRRIKKRENWEKEIIK